MTEKEIDAVTEMTENNQKAVVDKFLAKKMMAASGQQHSTKVLSQENNEGGYQESSFYEDISNLSYIKDF